MSFMSPAAAFDPVYKTAKQMTDFFTRPLNLSKLSVACICQLRQHLAACSIYAQRITARTLTSAQKFAELLVVISYQCWQAAIKNSI
jgi:hypothetical protein